VAIVFERSPSMEGSTVTLLGFPATARRVIVLLVALAVTAAACSRAADPVLVEGGGRSAEAPAAAVDSDLSGALSSGFSSAGSDEASGPPPFTVVAQAVADRVMARAQPGDSADVVAELANPTAVGGPLVFRAVDGSVDGNGEWIEVHLPVQPNGTTGWVRRADVTLSNNPYRIEIDRAGFGLRVYRQNVLWLETTVAIGTGDTPTPVGDFYLMELLAPPDPDGAYGPYAFGLSGFSEVLDSFGGADTAIIGLHGTNDPDSLGTNVSHGCIRIENAVIERLALNVPLGTPVAIT
jgi:lipoprotein-anchoring transpeptidase ErfK/SrfK